MNHRLRWLFFPFALLVGCGDSEPTSPQMAPPDRLNALVDGSTSADHDGFYFLSPLVESPTYTGEFNGALAPRVEICQLDDFLDPTDVCDPSAPLAAAFGPTEISVDPVDEKYQVGWNTHGLDTNLNYRITVLVGDEVLGYRDVHPVMTSQEVPNPQTQELYVFRVGSNIPIKFRIEKGLFCDPAAVECAEASIFDGNGGTVATSTGGVTLASSSLPMGEELVTVVVERLELPAGAECLDGLDLPQFGPCFRIRTIPELQGELEIPATVSVCVDLDVDFSFLSAAQQDLPQIYKQSDDGSILALPNVLSTVCGEEVAAADLPRNGLMRMAVRGWRAVAEFVGPGALHAADLGMGGLTTSFSRFRWALPARMEVHGGDGQVTLAGTTVPVDPAVRVLDALGGPVAGATVHFEVTSGGGSSAPVDPITVTTGADGVARVDYWQLGPAAGLNTLDAFGRGISDGPVSQTDHHAAVTTTVGRKTFTAIACEPGYGSATADGVMQPSEWQCARAANFTANLSGGSTPATLFWMNDGANLYLAVRIARGAADKVNTLRFNFDNDNDGVAEAGDDAIQMDGAGGFADEYLTDKCVNSGQSSCGAADTKDGGTKDGSGGFSNDGTWSVYEIAHPLNSGDTAHDIAVAAGDRLGFYLSLQQGNGAQGNTQWPGFRVFHVIDILSGGMP